MHLLKSDIAPLVKNSWSTLKWFGHLQRRQEDYIVRRMLQIELLGKRSRGTPKERLRYGVNEDMKIVSVTVEDASGLASCRETIGYDKL